MKVYLLDHTRDAETLLLKTKNTRLSFASDPSGWSEEQRAEHLAYMKDTIKSSWEFVSYVFKIEGVSRAFTHQLVRTRSGSYAQESQRAVDVSDHEVIAPDIEGNKLEEWNISVKEVMQEYKYLLQNMNFTIQDARGILPTNISTSIVAKFDLRTLHNMGLVRLCVRTQGEYQRVFREMRSLVLGVHPWADDFIQPQCAFNGTCAFPRYGKKECRFYDSRMDLTEIANETRSKFWSSEIFSASPKASYGKVM